MEELNLLLQKQSRISCYWLPSGKILVPRSNGGIISTKSVKLHVQSDADFYIQGVTGVYGYWHGEGADKHLKALPASGSEDVTFKIEDGSSGHLLSGDNVAVETFFIGGGVGKPLRLLPFRHVVQRNSSISFEFQNASGHDFEISFTLHGLKYF